jgi:hypothetical protein
MTISFSKNILHHAVSKLGGVALSYGLCDRGLESRQGLRIFLFTTAFRLDLGPPSFLSNGYQRLFPGGKAGGA